MNKNKILIIDDDLDLLASMKLYFESNNYEIVTAVNTRIGSELIAKSRPDLIVLDIIMDTNLEGFNFLNSLKSDAGLKDIPVIINTSIAKAIGVNMRSAIEDVESLPHTTFIDKSGDWDELIQKVKELLN